jgi:hypothetical protein
MALHTDTLVVAVQDRYENTDQPLDAIGAEFGISGRTVSRMANEHGWKKRSERVSYLPTAMQLLEEAKALAVTLPRKSTRHPEVRAKRASKDDGPDSSSEQGPPPSRLGASRLAPQDDGDGSEVAASEPTPSPSPIDRLEALVVKQIEAEEIKRSLYAGKRRAKTTDDRCARTLATLTQTLHTLQRLRAGENPEHESGNDDFDDRPRDIDEFRRDLARRIEAFVASRTDGGDAG